MHTLCRFYAAISSDHAQQGRLPRLALNDVPGFACNLRSLRRLLAWTLMSTLHLHVFGSHDKAPSAASLAVLSLEQLPGTSE